MSSKLIGTLGLVIILTSGFYASLTRSASNHSQNFMARTGAKNTQARSLASQFAPLAGHELDERIEVSLQAVFAPSTGFDDNDNVEVVAHGDLPNSCYTLADSFFEILEDGITIDIHQYATLQKEGICAQGAALPPHLSMLVPFTRDITIGRLNAADYVIQYHKPGSITARRALQITRASAPTIDENPYAIVTNAQVGDVQVAGDSITVTLSGLLNSTCTELTDEIQVIKQNDVYVILPTLKVKPEIMCAQMLKPFSRKVELGKAIGGEFLVHVRSMNGQSVNRVFEVQ